MSEGNILVIDDEEAMCNLLKDSLSEKGYNVVATQKAKDGLAQVEYNKFDLIITDLRMPEMDGLEIIKQIKKLDPDSVLVIITAYPSFETAQEALRLTAYDYITKPFNLDQIFFTVRRAVEFRLLKLDNKKLMERLEKENILLEKKVDERTKDLKDLYHNIHSAYMSTVKALAQAIDAKDHYTHSHSEKVTKYALAIANEMGFSTQEMETLREACQLHDLGKIGIHDYVLNKTAKLSEKEWKEIKLHSSHGAEILGPLSFLEDVIVLIRQHHERFDGKGYPDGLKRDQIKLGARIIAVADAFDAMISERPYRKAYSQRYAISVLKRNSDTQFDAKVVETFLAVLKKNPRLVGKKSPTSKTKRAKDAKKK